MNLTRREWEFVILAILAVALTVAAKLGGG